VVEGRSHWYRSDFIAIPTMPGRHVSDSIIATKASWCTYSIAVCRRSASHSHGSASQALSRVILSLNLHSGRIMLLGGYSWLVQTPSCARCLSTKLAQSLATKLTQSLSNQAYLQSFDKACSMTVHCDCFESRSTSSE
jgi:hypothetical protein